MHSEWPKLYGVLALLSAIGLTHCVLVVSSTVTCWTSPSFILGVLGLFCSLYSIFDGKSCLTKNVDPDQMPHDVASDLSLHCLPMTLWASR